MSTGRDANVITVHAINRRATRGWLHYGTLRYPCALGRSGRQIFKRETDGASPIGLWPVRRAYYRGDKLMRPLTVLPLQVLQRRDGWCDAPGNRNYNRPVTHPYAASAEQLWRDDNLYDIIVVLGHNERPRAQGLGSAIFMHVARPGFLPTEGCIALRQSDLLRLLASLKPDARLHICG